MQSTHAATATRAETYASMQLLRFVAAMLVVLTHTTEAIVQRIDGLREIGIWMAGTSGVDIFFVISGFVMVVACRPDADFASRRAAAADFMRRRLLRVVPLYWFYTLLKLLAVLALPALALRTTLEPQHVLASFLFVPATSPWGLVQPLLPVGWTLNFEMLFYLLFALAIAVGASRLLFCLAAFAAIHLFALWFPDVTALAFYGRSILFEFAIGMLVARLRHLRLPLPGALLLLGAGSALLCWQDDSIERLLRQGLGAGLLVMGGIQLERHLGVKALLARLAVLGDISYSCYLCHSFVVPLCVAAFAHTALRQPAAIVLLTLAAVVAASFASHFWIERPLTALFKRRHPNHAPQTPTPTPATAAAAATEIDIARIGNL